MYFLQLQVKGLVNKMTKSINAYKGMTKRNVKVYLKDRMAVFLSLITQIIVLGLFLIFLKDTYLMAINDNLGELKSLVSEKDIQTLINSWLVSGVVGTAVVTVALNSLNIMVTDKQNKISFDYCTSPVKNSTVVLSYFSGALINTILLSTILLSAGFIFIAVTGEFVYSITDILAMFGLTILGSISSTLILMIFVSFFKKNSTLSAFGVMISASIGFVIGAYVPVSQFGSSVQTIVNLVPGSHIAGMMRNILMTPAINNIDKTLNGIDKGAFTESIKMIFAFNLNIFDKEIGVSFMLIFSLIIIAIALILNLFLYRFTSKNK